MYDKDLFADATRVEDWTHLAGSGAAARAKSAGLRRTRYAGIAGATAAVAVGAVGAVGIVGSLGTGGGARAGASAGSAGSTGSTGSAGNAGGSKPSSGSSGSVGAPNVVTTPANPTTLPWQSPVKGTMGALFQQWKSCPDSDLTAEPVTLQQRWRDACHRDVATLSALLPDYNVTPGVASIRMPQTDARNLVDPEKFNNPSFVIPAGYTPVMGPNIYRTEGKDGVANEVFIHASGQDDNNKPPTGEAVTLPNGLQGWLTLGTGLVTGQLGYEIYIVNHGHTFSMFTLGTPNFDFKAVVTSPQFADMVVRALAEPES